MARQLALNRLFVISKASVVELSQVNVLVFMFKTCFVLAFNLLSFCF